MIKLTDSNGRERYLHRDAIAEVIDAAVSSKWHGTYSYIRMFDGATMDCQQKAAEVARLIEADKANNA